MYQLTLPDKSIKEVASGFTYRDFIEKELPFLKNKALAVRLNGEEILDLSRTVEKNSNIEVLTYSEKLGWETFQHSAAHLLGMAVQNLYKNANLTVGPVIDNGPGFFYYDIDFQGAIVTPEDFPKIEAEMEKIVKADHPVWRKVVSKKQAIETFQKLGEKYKIEIIDGIPSEEVSIYGMGEWFDLCRGPHVPNSGILKSFKLTAISGAYWKADKNNSMLTRIYGVAFPTKKNWINIFFKLRKRRKEIIERSEKRWIYFLFKRKVQGFLFGIPKEQFFGIHSQSIFVPNVTKEVIRKSKRLRYFLPNFGRSPVIGIIFTRTCILRT
ncbi:threonine/alanine tRNA ligase second additional domain protein [Leptospira interrogans str. 2006001854]|uniref:threonine--tRNA ligase n=1 Tax=Leptospira interrogans str. 2006001854 TaxID=1001590 RepID=M6GFH9_LEPIR|nr:threonine/alanine tRNA ligase second additional domain protein [Leptospira interrogans str. 2006001854]